MAGNLLTSKAYYHILNKESAPWSYLSNTGCGMVECFVVYSMIHLMKERLITNILIETNSDLCPGRDFCSYQLFILLQLLRPNSCTGSEIMQWLRPSKS
jgi:hypothetical protein